ALSFIGSANLAGPAVFPQTATFDASQLPASLSITGTTGIQNIIVNNAMAWSGAAWTFSNWTAGTDTVTINGTGGDDWITGSIQADKIAGGPATIPSPAALAQICSLSLPGSGRIPSLTLIHPGM